MKIANGKWKWTSDACYSGVFTKCIVDYHIIHWLSEIVFIYFFRFISITSVFTFSRLLSTKNISYLQCLQYAIFRAKWEKGKSTPDLTWGRKKVSFAEKRLFAFDDFVTGGKKLSTRYHRNENDFCRNMHKYWFNLNQTVGKLKISKKNIYIFMYSLW